MARGLDFGKRLEWRERLARFRKSGATITAFCRSEGVSAPSFFQWRKRLEESSSESEGDRNGLPGFAAVRVVGSACVSALLPGGTRVEIPTADAQTLRVAIEALARADAERAGARGC